MLTRWYRHKRCRIYLLKYLIDIRGFLSPLSIMSKNSHYYGGGTYSDVMTFVWFGFMSYKPMSILLMIPEFKAVSKICPFCLIILDKFHRFTDFFTNWFILYIMAFFTFAAISWTHCFIMFIYAFSLLLFSNLFYYFRRITIFPSVMFIFCHNFSTPCFLLVQQILFLELNLDTHISLCSFTCTVDNEVKGFH